MYVKIIAKVDQSGTSKIKFKYETCKLCLADISAPRRLRGIEFSILK